MILECWVYKFAYVVEPIQAGWMDEQWSALKEGLKGSKRANALSPQPPCLSGDCGCRCCYQYFLLWLNSQCIVGLRYPHLWDSNSICLQTHAHIQSRYIQAQARLNNPGKQTRLLTSAKCHRQTQTHTHSALTPSPLWLMILAVELKCLISHHLFWTKSPSSVPCVCVRF